MKYVQCIVIKQILIEAIRQTSEHDLRWKGLFLTSHSRVMLSPCKAFTGPGKSFTMSGGKSLALPMVMVSVVVTDSPHPQRFLAVILNLYSAPGFRKKASKLLIGDTPSCNILTHTYCRSICLKCILMCVIKVSITLQCKKYSLISPNITLNVKNTLALRHLMTYSLDLQILWDLRVEHRNPML